VGYIHVRFFAWEDPSVDLEHMDLKKDDVVLAITSGGCNILEYVLNDVEHVWGVDMNPAQNDILELKLAMLRSPFVTYQEFWQVFGTGKLANFSEFLDLKVSAYLSPRAYRFWKSNVKTFEKVGLYVSPMVRQACC
jgi:betaine lipid synthase